MLSWTIQITIISIILIILVHHLINFFKSTLTVPKIKDLVNTSNKKYENMYNIIQNSDNANTFNANTFNANTFNANSDNMRKTNEYTLIDLLPTQEQISEQPQTQINNSPSMKNELKNFLKKQLNDSISETSYTNY